MSDFTIVLQDIDGAYVPINPRLTVTPQRWSDAMPGGPDSASIQVAGPDEAIRELVHFLGHRLFISSGEVPNAWHGMINAIDLEIGPVKYQLSLEDVSNRIQIMYTYEDVDGQQVTAETDWGTHQPSIERYGYRELRQSESDLDATQADALLVRVLDALALPRASIEVGTSAPATAMIYGVGLWSTLGLRYYGNNIGREEHTDGNGDQPLGLGFESLLLGWADIHEKMHVYDHAAQFAEFAEGDKFVIDTPAYLGTNVNGPYTVASGPSATEVTTVQADVDNEIIFEFPDEIISETGIMAAVRAEEYLRVENSSLNDRFHLVSSTDQNKMFTREGSTGNVQTEGGSTLITLTQGCVIEVEEEIGEDYGPGYLAAAAAVTVYGIQIAQSFYNQSGGAFELAKVGISLWKVGDPTDSVTVKLCANSAGVPGATLATGTIAASDVRTVAGWIWADMDTAVTLDDETSAYFLVVQRVGDPDPANYYRVTVDSDGEYDAGSMLVHDGKSAWHASDSDLCFRAWNTLETTAQIGAMISDGGEFIESVQVRDDSGLYSNEWRDGLSKVQDEVESLIGSGTVSGDKLRATVTADGVAIIDSVSQPESPQYILNSDGDLLHQLGAKVGPGKTISGEWVQIDDAPGGGDDLVVTNVLYVASSEFDASTGRLRLCAQGNPDPWSVGEIVQG